MDAQIRTATPADMPAVWRLTHDRYCEMGYCNPQPDGMLRHYAHLDDVPETTVLVAVDKGDEVIGTCSYTLDGPAGLHVDATFPDECHAMRTECLLAGMLLGAAWRIVTRQPDRRVIMGLCLETVNRMLEEGVDVALYSFHPHHARIYERMMGAKTIAGPRDDGTVAHAPAMLLRHDRREAEAFLAKHHRGAT